MNLKPGSEAHRLTRAATTLVSNLYPMGYTHPDEHTKALSHARCIETARALTETLHHFGVPAKLLPVDILVMNPEAMRQNLEGTPVSDWPDEAWSVGVLDDPNAIVQQDNRVGGWNGHMLVAVAKEWLCDPNAGQFYRPGKINMPASWVIEYPRDQWNADRDGWATQGVISTGTATPRHPEFPILQIRRRPDNIRWKEGTAATIDLGDVVRTCVTTLQAIKDGEVEDNILLTDAGGHEIVADISSVIQRYRGVTA